MKTIKKREEFKKLFPFFLFFSIIISGFCIDYKGEKVVYGISPAGWSVYEDLGIVELEGKKVNLSTFVTHALGFYDLETIYSDPDTSLPIKIERDISMWGMREYIIEEYDLKNCTVTFKNFEKKGKGEPKIQISKAESPIHNAILLPFYLRKLPDLKIGWTMDIYLPDKFKVELINIEEIKIPSGKFKAYHFTSTPNKFEIWVSVDDPRVPIKIKSMGGLGYSLIMRKYSSPQ